MMYHCTPEQHQQVVDVLKGVQFCVPPAQRPMVTDALAMLKVMWPVHQIDTSAERVQKLEENVQMLLEALKDLKRQYSEHPDAFWDWGKARAAIAQVEGETNAK